MFLKYLKLIFPLIGLCYTANQQISAPFTYASSPYHMDKLIQIDHQIVQKIKFSIERMNFTQRQVCICKNFISEFEIVPMELRGDYAKHPFLSYLLIQRYTRLPVALLSPLFQEILEIFAENEINWPSKFDLLEIIDPIIRLHHFYDLDVENLRLGKFSENDEFLKQFLEFKLTAFDSLEIGLRALQTNFLTTGIEWIELTRKILLDNSQDKSTTLSIVESYLSDAFLIHDSALQKNDGDLKLFSRPLLSLNYTEKRTTIKSLVYKTRQSYKPDLNDKIGMDANLVALCKGQELMTEKARSKLFCEYKNYYMREKIEYLSNNPQIAQIYEAISISKIQHFTEISKRKIREKRFYQDIDILHGSHFSLFFDIKNISHPIVQSVMGRISYITGLADMREKAMDIGFQMSSFSQGIIYRVHRDHVGEEDRNFNFELFGDRLATFLMYLSDVDSGGRTAFVQALTSVKPIKGSAIFWFNSYRNGKFKPNVYHGGCPVLIGRKLILARWFNYFGQDKVYPCTLDERMK